MTTTQPPAEDEAAAPDRPDRLLTPRFCLVVVVGLLYFLSLGVLLPVVPLFVKHGLGGDDLAVGIGVGAFAVGAVVLRPFAGRIGDRYGRRLLIIGGALIVAVAVALYHFSSGLGLLVLARLLGGAGEAAFFVGAGTMITDLAPEARRGEAISYWSVAVYGGLAFGPLLGERVLHGDDYSLVWTVSASLALGAALLGLLTRETVTPARLDGDGRAIRPPLLHRASLPPGLILFLGMVTLAGFVEFVPLYARDIGLEDAAPVFLAYGCLVLVVRIVGARIPDRWGPLRAGSWAAAGASLGMVIMAAIPNVFGLYAGTIVFSCGMSLMYPAMLTLALTGVPATERGSSVGTVSSFFDLSQGLGAVILGLVAALGGYRSAFLGAAVFAATGLVLLRSGIDPRTRRPTDHRAAEAASQSLEGDPP